VQNSKLNYTKCSRMHPGWGGTGLQATLPQIEIKKKNCVDAVISNGLCNLRRLKLTTEIGRCLVHWNFDK
jgi:hypothetical protein